MNGNRDLWKKNLRKCFVCREIKTLSNQYFYKAKSSSGSLSYLCIDCDKRRGKERKRRQSGVGVGKYWTTKYSADKRGLSFEFLNRKEFEQWFNEQEKLCAYCGIREDHLFDDPIQYQQARRKIQKLSIDRKDNALGYSPRNLTLACYRCNSVKSDLFSFEEMKKVGEMIAEKRKKPIEDVRKIRIEKLRA